MSNTADSAFLGKTGLIGPISGVAGFFPGNVDTTSSTDEETLGSFSVPPDLFAGAELRFAIHGRGTGPGVLRFYVNDFLLASDIVDGPWVAKLMVAPPACARIDIHSNHGTVVNEVDLPGIDITQPVAVRVTGTNALPFAGSIRLTGGTVECLNFE